MFAYGTPQSIDRETAISVLHTPNISAFWDQMGQSLVQREDVESAVRFFRRSEISYPPFLEKLDHRMAMAMELNNDFRAAAERYLSVYRADPGNNRSALYRMIGCLHRLNDLSSIPELLEDHDPRDWRDYRQIGMIAAVAFYQNGQAWRALSWLLTDPDVGQRGSSSANFLLKIFEARPASATRDDIERLLKETAHQVFQVPSLVRDLLKWIIRAGESEALAGLLLSPELIEASQGSCLRYAATLFRELRERTTALAAERMDLIWRPDSAGGVCLFIPSEAEFHDYDIRSVLRWAKATIICSDTNSMTVNNAVIALKIADNFEDTTVYLSRAGQRFKSSPILLYNVGSHLNEKSFAERAEPLLKRAVLLEPAYAKAWSSYAVSKSIMLESADGVKASKRALSTDPGLQSGHTNLAMAYRGLGDLDSALAAGKAQLRHSPSDAIARMGVAFNQLNLGALEEGFENYRVRWAQKNFPSMRRPFPQKEWTLQKIPPSKKVVIYMEQGLGDEFMFSWFLNYADSVAPGQVIVECDPRIIRIFERSFPTIEFHPMTNPVQRRFLADDVLYKTPVGHLPGLFSGRIRHLIKERWKLAIEPWVGGYGWIKPDPQGVARWREKLLAIGGHERLCVGIAWRSRNLTRTRRLQYLSPDEIASSLPDNSIAINLQYVYDEEEMATLVEHASKRGIDIVTFDDLDLKDDLDDIIDLSAALDCIVTPLTSTAFMGGVTGTPTWVFRSSESGTIWQQLGTPHIPWIPSIRLLFRNPRNSWSNVIENMRLELDTARQQLMSRRPRSSE